MGKFTWQEGFGAFTLDKSQIASKIDYIKINNSITQRSLFGKNILNSSQRKRGRLR